MKTNSNRLTVLAADIQAAHRDIQASAEQMAERAIAAGNMLIEAKATVPHGKWQDWLTDHVGMSDRSARRYMQLARSGMKTATVADLGIRAASQAIAHKTDRAVRRDLFSPDEEAQYQTWFAEVQDLLSAVTPQQRAEFMETARVQVARDRVADMLTTYIPTVELDDILAKLALDKESRPLVMAVAALRAREAAR